jgi:hypothetical protein
MEKLCSNRKNFFWKFDILSIFAKKNLSGKKFKFHKNLTRTTLRHFTWTRLTFTVIRGILLTMRNVSDKSCRQEHTFCVQQLKKKEENRAVYGTTRKKYGRAGQATDDNMAHVRCMLHT